MHPVVLADILPFALYEPVRDSHRRAIIAMKKHRRISLGEQMTLVFENTETMRFQIQEMVRAERLTDPAAIAHELATYNALLPGPRELAATLFVEITGSTTIAEDLLRFRGIEKNCVALEIGDDLRAPAVFATEGLDHPGKIAAVHYIRFPLGIAGAARVRDEATPLVLRIDHSAYTASVVVPLAMRASLRQDLL